MATDSESEDESCASDLGLDSSDHLRESCSLHAGIGL